MSDGKHTAGKWQIEGRRGPGYIISHGINAEQDGPKGYIGVLDPMFHIAGQPSDFDANARLIVTAPDFFEAASSLLEAWDARTTGAQQIVTGKSDADLQKQAMQALDRLRSAILRATGEGA